MPRFNRNKGYYTYEPKEIPRRYVLKKSPEDGTWTAESYILEDGKPVDLAMKHSDIPMKREASEIVDRWVEQGH